MRYKIKQGKGSYEKIRQKMEIYRALKRVQEKRGITPNGGAKVFENVPVPTEIPTDTHTDKAE